MNGLRTEGNCKRASVLVPRRSSSTLFFEHAPNSRTRTTDEEGSKGITQLSVRPATAYKKRPVRSEGNLAGQPAIKRRLRTLSQTLSSHSVELRGARFGVPALAGEAFNFHRCAKSSTRRDTRNIPPAEAGTPNRPPDGNPDTHRDPPPTRDPFGFAVHRPQ